MRLRIVEIVPLIGEQARRSVRAPASCSAKRLSHVLIVVRIGEGSAGTSTSSAPQSRSMSFFSWLWVSGITIKRPVSARAGDNRKADTGIAGGRLDHQAARLEFAAFFGLEDHPLSRRGPSRIGRDFSKFGFAEDGAAGQLGSPLQLDQRGIADSFDNVVVDFHAR